MYFRYAIHFFLLVVFVTFAGFINEVDADPPGAKISPLPPSSMKIFKDDEIFTGEFFFSRTSRLLGLSAISYSSPTAADLSSDWTVNYPVFSRQREWCGNPDSQIAAADAGMFVYGENDGDSHHESVIFARFRTRDLTLYTPNPRIVLNVFNQGAVSLDYLLWIPQTEFYLNAPKSVDVKVGDLDLLADEEGRLHDEIVVAFTYGDYADRVAVYVLKPVPLETPLKVVSAFSFDRPDDDEILDLVSVNIGDYNGDKFPDIAVTAGSSAADMPGIVNVYSYDHDSENQVVVPYVLTLKSSREVDQYGTNLDTASGDFDGKGKDELAVLSGSTGLHVGILQYGSEWNHTNDTYHTSHLDPNNDDGTYADANGLRAEAGNFLFDPANGYGLRKKQVVVVWTYEHRYLSSGVYDLSSLMDDNENNENIPVRLSYDGRDVDDGAAYRAGKFDIAVGNFVGHLGENDETNNSVTDQWILHSVWEKHTANIQYPVTFVYHLDADRWMHWDVVKTGATMAGIYPNAPVAVAFDNDGDTWRLGAPTHLVFNDVVSLDQIIQEPPKHVDYLPVDPDIWDGDWEIRNISGLRDFKMVYEKVDETSTNHQSTNTSTWSIGGAAKFKGSLSAEMAGVKVKLENKTKLSYDYDSNKSTYNSSYTCRDETLSAETNTDDHLHGTFKTINVWRYPIFNYYTEDTSNPLGVWDLVLPSNKQEFSCDGITFGDWYQPLHENRNVLSYPQYSLSQWPPDEEVGCFKWYDDSGNPTEICEILNNLQVYTWGNAATESIRWTTTSGTGSAKKYSHTLSESTELTLSTKVDAFAFFGGAKTKASFGVEFHNSNSWGGATEEESEFSNTTGITLNKPAGGELDLAYGFQTAAYITATGGAFKVAHATNPLALSTTSDLWKKYYNRRPDPALNLPNKFEFHTPSDGHLEDWWTLNTEETRKQMRGFFLRSNTENDLSGKCPILAMAPTDGDTVQLCARVYNYSLNQPAYNVNVKFYYTKWDIGGSSAIGDPVSPPGMEFTIPYLDGIQGTEPSMIEVCVPWDTTGLYISDPNMGYRFMVILDEENTIEEIHEFKDADGNEVPGGNNSGYWPWSNAVLVMPAVPDGAVGDARLSEPDVSMQGDSLAIETENGLVTDGRGLEFVRGKTYRLRAHLTSDMDHSAFRHVFFFEGDPDSNGKVIANQLSFGVKTGRGFIWTNWTPQETGEKTLHVRYLEAQHDTQPGNNQDSLKVNVVELVQLQEGLLLKNKNAEGEDRITFKLENCLNLSDVISELADSSVHISVSTTDGNTTLYSSREIPGAEFWPNGNETRYEYKEKSPEKGKVTLLPVTNEIVADIKKTTIGEITDDTTNITVRITIGPKTYKAVNTWTLKKDNKKKTKLIFRQ